MDKHGQYRPLVKILALLAALVVAAPAQATCRLALLIGLDISSSVDDGEDRLQRAGLAAALRAPEIQQALLAIKGAPVALAVYEWSGRVQQDVLLDWQILDSPAAINNAAGFIAASSRPYAGFPTAIGHSLEYAGTMFARAPACDFQTLDLTGDGVNNDGFGPRIAYARNVLTGVTVNVLAVGGGTVDDQALYDFFIDHVLQGPGSFLEIARDYADFKRAMRLKLHREVLLRVISGVPEPLPHDG